MRVLTEQEETALVRAEIRAALLRLCLGQGIGLDRVLAVAHAETAAQIAATFGGDVPADCLRGAADQVEHLPAVADSALARAVPVGRA